MSKTRSTYTCSTVFHGKAADVPRLLSLALTLMLLTKKLRFVIRGVGDTVGATEGTALRAEGRAVAIIEGEAVGATVGDTVDTMEGGTVGRTEGDTVGAIEGTALRAVGRTVGIFEENADGVVGETASDPPWDEQSGLCVEAQLRSLWKLVCGKRKFTPCVTIKEKVPKSPRPLKPDDPN